MKKFFKKIFEWLEMYGQARAAAIFAHNGKIAESIKEIKK